jgi:hypothetical protein
MTSGPIIGLSEVILAPRAGFWRNQSFYFLRSALEGGIRVIGE